MTNIDEVTRPWARYGRPQGRRPDDYRLLEQSPGFPAHAAETLESVIARRFEWHGLPEGEPDECTGLWPLQELGALFVRFCNDGSDAHHRPHAVRIDAVYVANDDPLLSDPHLVARCLAGSAWPNQPGGEQASVDGFLFRNAAEIGGLGNHIERFVKEHGRMPRLLVGAELPCRTRDFELKVTHTGEVFHSRSRVDWEPSTSSHVVVDSSGHRLSQACQPAQSREPPTNWRRGVLRIAIAALLVGYGAWATGKYYEQINDNKSLQQKLNNHTSKSEREASLQKENAKLQSRLNDFEQLIRDFQDRSDELLPR